ncbi:putative transcriptional regulator, AsnC family [Nitrosotalea sinensis]|uniref:Putative transcriptional regulator, AsnC family n=1 Tax=Nitrosotalea sinensis TaxID=1499975 RepID=A0A2H1EHD1_9ARCH|nr:winged helix-turn-helix transcriptional regulator [Candidatus Nitrosotalea sinensis]SHO46018.1 putative transcriptional regulator, AsnC family [Candidatus Nitrosotalea sinensis]
MPLKLDDIDLAILESLVKDGRKSFRQISRETKVSTPTVKLHYERLVNAGLIKGVSVELDLGKLETKTSANLDQIKHKSLNGNKIKIGKDMLVKITCDYCNGPTHNKPTILKVGSQERFFCCTSCRTLYKEKYRNKIESITKSNQE